MGGWYLLWQAGVRDWCAGLVWEVSVLSRYEGSVCGGLCNCEIELKNPLDKT